MEPESETLDLELLRTLCSLPGVSGNEAAVTDEVRRRLDGVAGEMHRDAIGNLCASTGGTGRPHVALVAHADQIGYIVTDADERGFISLERVGEAFGDLLPGRELVVHTANGPLHGVVGRTPLDVLPKKRRGKVAEVRDQWLDIGARSREEALSSVRIGDPVTFAARFLELRNGLLASPCLDDRAGLYVVVRVLEQWAAAHPGRNAGDPEDMRVTAVATAREETGFLGARTLAQALDCDVAIVVDVIFASDDPGSQPKLAGGRVELGGGPVIARGTASAEHLVELAEAAGKARGIPLQLRAAAGMAGTDADDLLTARECAVLSVSIPLRYMHSALEIASGSDLEECVRLLLAILKSLESPPSP
jgi:putative aminopeptidase FrvX